jgi:hypothetical protein
MRVRTAATAVMLTVTLSALAFAQQHKQVAIRADDGRWVMASRALNPADVPPNAPLYGIAVIESPEGRGVIVSALSGSSLLRIGDRIDEIQLPGIKDRERNANPGYWPYQVLTPSDFYRLAAKCVESCLVRLRGIESTRFGLSQTLSGPRVFGYLPVGTGAGFGVELDDDSGAVATYVDLRSGERFGPPASVAFGR